MIIQHQVYLFYIIYLLNYWILSIMAEIHFAAVRVQIFEAFHHNWFCIVCHSVDQWWNLQNLLNKRFSDSVGQNLSIWILQFWPWFASLLFMKSERMNLSLMTGIYFSDGHCLNQQIFWSWSRFTPLSFKWVSIWICVSFGHDTD